MEALQIEIPGVGSRQLADEFLANEALARTAAWNRVRLICELAEIYRVERSDWAPTREELEEQLLQPVPGGPVTSEFLALELAALMGCTEGAAEARIRRSLDLKFRHPRLYAAVGSLSVEADRALAAVAKCTHLPDEIADEVTARWVEVQAGRSWGGAFNELQKLIVAADPELAAKREEQALSTLGVHVWGFHDGTMNLTGRLDVLDARYVDAAVQRMAEVLIVTHPHLDLSQRRAKALGVLANPAYALALLQGARQPLLIEDDAAHTPADEAQRHDPHGCAGHVCGTNTAPLHALRPKLELAVTIDVDACGEASGAAIIDRAGAITLRLLREQLAGVDVTVRPVVNVATVPDEDQYRPSTGMSRALRMTYQRDVFPFAERHASRCDADHTISYRAGRRGQTSLRNLAFLGRKPHRAKTSGFWSLEHTRLGRLVWTSPLGYRYSVTRHGTRRLE